MKLTIEIDMKGAAFMDQFGEEDEDGKILPEAGPEVARILRQLSCHRLDSHTLSRKGEGVVHDYNGNVCGKWKVVPK